MRILALSVNHDGWTYDTLAREQRALADVVRDRGGEMTFAGPGYDYATNNVAEMVRALGDEGRQPDLILSYLSPHDYLGRQRPQVIERFALKGQMRRFPRGLSSIRDIPKVIWTNDFWQQAPQEWESIILGQGFDAALATYAPPFVRQSDFVNAYPPTVRDAITFHGLPRAVDTTLFRGYGESRAYDVTLLGALGPFYPLRGYFDESMRSQTWLNYFHREHPGYGFDRTGDALTGEAYARALARSRIAVGCTSRFNIPFIKLYEILASGAMLMCDEPCGAEELGLRAGVNYVSVTRETFLPAVRYYLEHDQRRERIAAAGQALARERHSIEQRAGEAANLLASIIKDQRSTKRNGAGGRKSLNGGTTKKMRSAAGNIKRVMRVMRAGAGRFVRAGRVIATGCDGAAAKSRSQSDSTGLWEPVKGGTQLDWSRVIDSPHILEIGRTPSLDELRMIQWLGLNACDGDPPVITEHAELVMYRPMVLADLAQAIGARRMAEIGTARGMQSMCWARYLERACISDGRIVTCDIVGDSVPVYRTPLSGVQRWTRNELWRNEIAARHIRFVHGDSGVMAAALLEDDDVACAPFDLVYIDGEHTKEAVLADYENLSPYLSDQSVLIFDDCDPRFPGVEQAVNQIADARDQSIELIRFGPAAYGVAVMGSPVSLRQLGVQEEQPVVRTRPGIEGRRRRRRTGSVLVGPGGS